jgi:hypothetical protein
MLQGRTPVRMRHEVSLPVVTLFAISVCTLKLSLQRMIFHAGHRIKAFEAAILFLYPYRTPVLSTLQTHQLQTENACILTTAARIPNHTSPAVFLPGRAGKALKLLVSRQGAAEPALRKVVSLNRCALSQGSPTSPVHAQTAVPVVSNAPYAGAITLTVTAMRSFSTWRTGVTIRTDVQYRGTRA